MGGREDLKVKIGEYNEKVERWRKNREGFKDGIVDKRRGRGRKRGI